MPYANVAPTDRRGDVYYIRRNDDILLLDDQMVYPNGITLSLDEKTLFVDDTFGEYVYAFDVQSDGQVQNKREFVKLQEPEQWPPWGLRSRAEGMAIDSKESSLCGNGIRSPGDPSARRIPRYDSGTGDCSEFGVLRDMASDFVYDGSYFAIPYLVAFPRAR
jgi:SMP-30/Gluconolactonase/LRE-like region